MRILWYILFATRLHNCSLKFFLISLQLKHRPNFLDLYLNPAMEEGFVRMLYPDSPRHPRQRYLLTVKGTMVYNHLERN